MVEGWPEEFVTDPSITHATNADGRTIVGGLKHDGIEFSERIVPLEGKIQATGMTFKIVPTGNTRLSDVSSTDPATASLSTYPDTFTRLTADWVYDDTAAPSVAAASLDDGTVYHIGTEAIRVGTPYQRNVWATLPQSHYTGSWFYDRPPSMEGRRCYLYRYENADSGAGDGTVVWRGVVATQPTLDRDCVTWSIKTQPITHLLKQTIGGGFGESKPQGLYFSWRSAFCGYIWLGTNPTAATSYEFKITGVHTEFSLVAAFNSGMALALSSTGADAYYSSVRLVRTTEGWDVVAVRSTAAGTAATSIGFLGGSFLTGFANTLGRKSPDHWVFVDGSTSGGTVAMADPGEYRITLTPHDMPWGQYEYANASGSVLGWAPTKGIDPAHFTVGASATLYPENRVYLNADLSGAASVSFGDVFDDGVVFAGNVGRTHIYTISGTGTDTTPDGIDINYIELDGIASFTSPFTMAANGDSTITVVRVYAVVGPFTAFVQGLMALSVEANRGDTPFLTEADFFTPLTLADTGLGPDILERQYAFTKQLTVEDVLARELQLASHMMRLASDGRIEFVPIALPTYGQAEWSFDHSNIITPPDGAWVTSEPQRDGIITSVTVQQHYDAIEDKWTDAPIVIQDDDAVSTHKNRGRGKMSIKTYSTPVNPANYDFIKNMAGRFLAFASREYVIVTIRVTHDYFDVLCGDNVELSHRSIPDGNGRRGVIEAPGVVIERRWDGDPASKSMGDLTIWTAAKHQGGYCPSGLITAHADNTGDNWTLTFDPANPVNIDLSTQYTSDSGAITRSFEVDDAIIITQINDATPVEVAGVVESKTGDTITVQLAATWTPGSDAWVMLYADDSTAVNDQLRQVFVADASLVSDAGRRVFL